MVPMMTRFAGMGQHAAVGTSSAAVTGTGVAGMLSFGSAGAVDFAASAAIAVTAMVTARAGARFTTRFDPVQLQRAFACFQLAVAPMVPAKAALVSQNKTATASSAGGSANSSAGGSNASNGETARVIQLAQLAAVGVAAGFASGMFGIGGGVILTPALCLLTDMPWPCVLGTTLASMIPPSAVSAATHYRLGNAQPRAALVLCMGSAAGAAASGQVALRVPEEPLQWLFAIIIAGMGGQKLWALRAVK